jgi:cysteine protease ATG4
MDPSMLIAFLIRDETDWNDWRRNVENAHGKAVIHVADRNPALLGPSRATGERDSAIDEVESVDDDDTILVD